MLAKIRLNCRMAMVIIFGVYCYSIQNIQTISENMYEIGYIFASTSLCSIVWMLRDFNICKFYTDHFTFNQSHSKMQKQVMNLCFSIRGDAHTHTQYHNTLYIYYTGCIIMPIEYVGRAFRTSSPTKKGTHFIHLSNAQLLLKTSGLVLEKCEIKLKNCDDSNKNGFFAVSDEREKLRYWKFSFSTQLSVKST